MGSDSFEWPTKLGGRLCHCRWEEAVKKGGSTHYYFGVWLNCSFPPWFYHVVSWQSENR